MKKIFIFVILALAVQVSFAQGYDPRRTISVSGSAEIKTPPDQVVIGMSVETDNIILDKAGAENDSKVSAILAMVRKLGVENKYVQTDFIKVEPRYDTPYSPNGEPMERKFLGYFVTKNITITLRDITKFEKLIAESLKLGTNFINNTEFGTTELRKFRDQARLQAINAAKEKAVALAGALGQKVGKPITITEGLINNYYNFSQNAMREAPAPAPPEEGNGSIAPGEIKIEANVNVTFELE